MCSVFPSRANACASTLGAGEDDANVSSEDPSQNKNSCILETMFVIIAEV